MGGVARSLVVVGSSVALLIVGASTVDAAGGKGGGGKNSKNGAANLTGAANQPKSAAQSVSPIVRDHSGNSDPLPSSRCGGGHGCSPPRTGGR